MTQPEQTFAHGTCRTTIFANTVQVKGLPTTIKKVVISKRYKDRDGEWKNSSSLDINDVPKMIAALTSAYAYLTKSISNNGNNGAFSVEEETIH